MDLTIDPGNKSDVWISWNVIFSLRRGKSLAAIWAEEVLKDPSMKWSNEQENLELLYQKGAIVRGEAMYTHPRFQKNSK